MKWVSLAKKESGNSPLANNLELHLSKYQNRPNTKKISEISHAEDFAMNTSTNSITWILRVKF